MKVSRKLLVFVVSAMLVLGLSGTVAFASETTTSATVNHGTMGVYTGTSADQDDTNIELAVGDSVDITIEPYVHVQYEGCQMDSGAEFCPESCGGYGGCFTKGMGCGCGKDPKTRKASVTATPVDTNVVSASAAAANGAVGSEVGSTVNGTVTLTAEKVGETTVTVRASLCDWLTTEKTYTVNVKNAITDTVSISDIDVHTDHSDPILPEQSMNDVETDTQTAYVTMYFDESMKIVDNGALVSEMMDTIKLHNRALGGTMGTIGNVALSEDGRSLSFELSGWTAPFSGQLTSEGTWINLMNEEETAYADSQMSVIMPNGLTTEVVERTVADGDTPASVTVKIMAPESSTRGMVHLVVLKNGQPVPEGSLTTYGATYTGHWHDYLNMTAETFVEYYASGVGSALGEDYTVTGNGDEITITANSSEAGDILDFHVLSYLNNGTKTIDTATLSAAVEAAGDVDADLWTAGSYAALTDAVAVGNLMLQDTTYYSQDDVNDAAEAIETAIDNLVDVNAPEEEEPGVVEDPDQTGGDNNDQDNAGNTQQAGNEGGNGSENTTGNVNDSSARTGDGTPVAAILALLLVSGAAAGIAVRKKAS